MFFRRVLTREDSIDVGAQHIRNGVRRLLERNWRNGKMRIKEFLNRIKCAIGLHDYGNWMYLGYMVKEGSSRSARICRREKCIAIETLILRRDK